MIVLVTIIGAIHLNSVIKKLEDSGWIKKLFR
jgi:hypothetical protein